MADRIIYALQDIEDNEYELNGDSVESTKRESLTFTSQSTTRELKIIQNSYLPGATLVGVPRIKGKDVTFDYMLNYADSDDFRLAENTLLMWLGKAVYLVDKDKNTRARIEYKSHRTKYGAGSLLHSANNSITFAFLTPFWTSQTEKTEIDSGTDITFNVTNDGFLDCPPDFVLTASVATSDFTITNVTTGQGMIVNDLSFGNTGLTQYNINNSEGTNYLGDVLRNNSIQAGTGFFNLIPGANEINITASASISATMRFNERCYT